jgi:outer membrane protein OmpA-like peptidoglycan-associated protein
VSAQGYAKAFPVASNTESSGRQLNRRVEVTIGGENNSTIVPRI